MSYFIIGLIGFIVGFILGVIIAGTARICEWERKRRR